MYKFADNRVKVKYLYMLGVNLDYLIISNELLSTNFPMTREHMKNSFTPVAGVKVHVVTVCVIIANICSA